MSRNLRDELLAPVSHPDAVRLALVHRREKRFRWWGLVEVALASTVLLVGLPLFALGLTAAPVVAGVYLGLGAAKTVAVFAGVAGIFGSVELPHRALRRNTFTAYRHRIDVIATSDVGHALQEAHARPRSAEEAERWVAQVLTAAAARKRVVVEMIDDPLTTTEVWYGGRPLLSEPGLPAVSVTAQALRDDGMEVALEAEAVECRRALPSAGRFVAAVLLVLIPILAPVLWLLRRPVGGAMRRAWCDLRGVPRFAIFRADAEGVHVWEAAGGVLDRRDTPADEVVGITWSMSLASDSSAERRAPTLRLVGEQDLLEFSPGLVGDHGFLIRDLLVAGLCRTRRADGLTACPYCGTVHAMNVGVGCPSCGGWAEVLGA